MSDEARSMWLVYSPGGEIPEFEGVFESEDDAKAVASQLVWAHYSEVKRYRAGDTSLRVEYLWRAAAKAVPAMSVICYFGEHREPVATRDSDGDHYEPNEVGVERAERNDKTMFVSAHAESAEEDDPAPPGNSLDEIKKKTADAEKASAADPTNLGLYQNAAFAEAVLKQHTDAATLGMGGMPAGGIPGLPGSGGGGGGGGTPFIGAEGGGSWTASGAGWTGPGGAPLGGPLGLSGGGGGGAGGGVPFIGGPGGAGEWTASGPGWSNDATKPDNASPGQGGRSTSPSIQSAGPGQMGFGVNGVPQGFGPPQFSPQAPGPSPFQSQAVNGIGPATAFLGPTLNTGPNAAIPNMSFYGPQAVSNPATASHGLAGLMTGRAMTDVAHPEMNALNSALNTNTTLSAHVAQTNTALSQSLSAVGQNAQNAASNQSQQSQANTANTQSQQQQTQQQSALSQSFGQVGQSAQSTTASMGAFNQTLDAATQSANTLGPAAATAMGPVATMPDQATSSVSATIGALSSAAPSMDATASSIGQGAMGAMAAGIGAGAGEASSAAGDAASGAASAAASASDSQSPSRVWMGLGKDMIDGGTIGIASNAGLMSGAATGAIHGVTDAARGVASDSGLMVGYSYVESIKTGVEQAVKTSEFQQLGFADIKGAAAKTALGILGLMGPAGSGAQSYQLSAQEVSFARGTAAQPPPQVTAHVTVQVDLDGKPFDQRIVRAQAAMMNDLADTLSRQRGR